MTVILEFVFHNVFPLHEYILGIYLFIVRCHLHFKIQGVLCVPNGLPNIRKKCQQMLIYSFPA